MAQFFLTSPVYNIEQLGPNIELVLQHVRSEGPIDERAINWKYLLWTLSNKEKLI